jgi:hypothetical protein
MSAPARMRLAGALVSAGHVGLGLAGELLVGVAGAWLLFGLCAAVSLVVALIAAPLLEPGRGGPGGGGDPPAPGGGDEPPEPPWWPEFERDFRAHAARRRAPA